VTKCLGEDDLGQAILVFGIGFGDVGFVFPRSAWLNSTI